MIIEIDPTAHDKAVADLCAALVAHEDVTAWPLRLGTRTFVAVSGDEQLVPEVNSPIVVGRHATGARGYWLVDRANGATPRTVAVGDKAVGAGPLWCAAGPCALESLDDAVSTGLAVRDQGAQALRIGVFKPRTSPYNFQGKERSGIRLLPELKAVVGLPIVTEVLDPRDVDLVGDVADCLQVGTRNMTNQALLKELGRASRPVLLKRASRAPVEEWLRAAEFIAAHGNPHIILCARGVVSFDTSLRFMPDLGAVLAVRERTDLPIVFDPSHSAGRADAVTQVALAAAAFGVDGLLVESHAHPERMYRPGDGAQAYPPGELGSLLGACAMVRETAASLRGRDEVRTN
jgi:3-deoxy-7-phosphoheptulonate synthase